MRTLVIAAHPDDEVLGCGGTMARLAREGREVFVAILGEGITSRPGTTREQAAHMLADLRASAQKASEGLGVKDLFMYSLPDNSFDSLPLLKVVQTVEQVVDKVDPEVVYTHHGGDLNVDHQITFRAVLTALRPMAGSGLRALYSFEVPSSTEWVFDSLAPSFRPNAFVDVSATLEAKIQAMQTYESEARAFPHPRSPQALAALAAYRGSNVGFEAAEAFELVMSRW